MGSWQGKCRVLTTEPPGIPYFKTLYMLLVNPLQKCTLNRMTLTRCLEMLLMLISSSQDTILRGKMAEFLLLLSLLLKRGLTQFLSLCTFPLTWHMMSTQGPGTEGQNTIPLKLISNGLKERPRSKGSGGCGNEQRKAQSEWGQEALKGRLSCMRPSAPQLRPSGKEYFL